MTIVTAKFQNSIIYAPMVWSICYPPRPFDAAKIKHS
jgi:hypothetical protein